MKTVDLKSLVGKTVYTSFWVNKKLVFVLEDRQVLMNVFRKDYDVAVKNGKTYRFENVKKFTIKEIAWAKSNVTTLMIITEEDDIYHFYCDIDIFGPITKLYRYDKYQKLSKKYYSRIG